VWLARRFRIDRQRRPRSLALRLPASLACTLIKQVADTAAAAAITGVGRGPFSFVAVYMSFLTYWVIVGGIAGLCSLQSCNLPSCNLI
jgi:hypothetical protein